jgi:hypothetical protein
MPHGTDFPVVTLLDDMSLASAVVATVPTIVRVTNTDIITKSPMASEVDNLKSKFRDAPERAEAGRGQRPVTAECQKAAVPFFDAVATKHFGAVPLEKVTQKELLATVKPHAFVICGGKQTQGVEGGMLATLRLGFYGTRQVVCMPADELLTFVAKESDIKSAATMRQMTTWLRAATPEALKKFKEQPNAKCYSGTLGPQDMLMLPAGWAFAERIQGTTDYAGMRFQFLQTNALPCLERLNTMMLAAERSVPLLGLAVDFLTLMD